MFRFTTSCSARAAYYIRQGNRSICSRWSQFKPCYFGKYSFDRRACKRSFRICCCSLNKDDSIRDNNKIISEYIYNRIMVGTNESITISLNTNEVVTSELENTAKTRQGILSDTEFLGIEVFPEIFEKLPPKCTGCGAILQSLNENMPGFIPENRNPNLSKNFDKNSFIPEIICMRCFNVKHYSKDVLPMVSPKSISNFLTHISRRKALILYIVDIMDIPGSFAENILTLVGDTKHIILVGNKIDQLPVDGHPMHQIQWIKRIMTDEAKKFGLQNANIRDVSLISTKTGFGIQNLVRAINKLWRKNSDIYLVGCNNSGKTSLFNLFVDLFTASRHSDNMLQRGTVSSSPGTTLSLLRYPTTKYRFLRLQNRLKSGYMESRSKENLKEVDVSEEIIDRQMTKYQDIDKPTENISKTLSPIHLQFVERHQNHHDFSWLYDTPGLYSNNQITHLLTNQELKLLNPTLWFVPCTIILTPGKVLFLGGLARVDYLEVKRISKVDPSKKEDVPKASQSIFFTIFASPNLPVHVTNLEKADNLYNQHTGNELLKIPSGGKTRLEEFPELKGNVFELTGVNWKRSAGDVMLSNIGWISVTAGSGSIVTVKAYTPNGAGLYLREPALLPTSVRQRGRRGVPYLGHINLNMYQGTRKRSPQLTKYFTKQNLGTSQWMKIAEKKRKEQRAALKFEIMKYHSKLRLGFSARSNPARYLPDYDIEDSLLETEEASEIEKIESGITKK